MSLSRIVSAGESRRMTASPDNSLWVIVTPVFKPAPGGGAIYADILARALAGAGADVVVFAERHPGTSAEEALVTRRGSARSEEHTSELQSLMRISYAVFCLK